MYILYISNFKKKLFLLFLVAVLWIIMFSLVIFIIPDSLLYNITVNRSIHFRYPLDFEVSQIFVNERLSKTSITTSSPVKMYTSSKFSSYKSLTGKFAFNYPSIFSLNPQDMEGGDILYHIDFDNRSKTIHGFVQVWNMPNSLKEFLDRSNATSQMNFLYFNSTAISSNGIPGFFWDYAVKGNDGKTYQSLEVFLKKEKRMYRISYFVRSDQWSKKQEETFWKMVHSFKVS